MRRVLFALMVGLFVTALPAVASVTAPTVPTQIVVEGTITAITVTGTASGKITVQPPAPCPDCPIKAPVTFGVTPVTKLFKDGMPCKLSDIKVGDDCRALFAKTSAGGLVAQIVYAKTVPPPMKWVSGKIIEKSLSSAFGRTFRLAVPTTDPAGNITTIVMWFAVNNTTKITLDGDPANYDDLAVGQSAEVGYVQPPPSPLTVIRPIPASVVNAKSPPAPPPVEHIIGKLVAIDMTNGIIRVLPRDVNCTSIADCAMPFRVTNLTKIDKFGPARLSELTIGDTVDVAYNPLLASPAPPPALSVVVLPQTLVGIVERVVSADSTGTTGILYLRLRTDTGVSAAVVAFKVVPATKIIKNGAPAKLRQLVRGDAAKVDFFQFGRIKVAALINAKSPGSTVP